MANFCFKLHKILNLLNVDYSETHCSPQPLIFTVLYYSSEFKMFMMFAVDLSIVLGCVFIGTCIYEYRVWT